MHPADYLDRLRTGGFTELASQLDEAQVVSVMAAASTHKRQPLARLLDAMPERAADGGAHQTLVNTNYAVRLILATGVATHKAWLAKKIGQSCDEKAFENATAALAEIRALGCLLQAGLTATPIPEAAVPTPDFRVEPEPWFVEVKSKQMNSEEAKQLAAFEARVHAEIAEHAAGEGSRGVRMAEHSVRPAGWKEGDRSVGENVASKFAGIKPSAKQAMQDHISVLWIDVQDEDWWTLSPDAVPPVRYWREEFTSVGLWHAFYGVRGLPIFESHSVDRRAISDVPTMSFDGMFFQASGWSGVAMAFRDAVVILENPSANNRLTPDIREKLLMLPGFDFEKSWLDWPPGARSLADRIADAHEMLRRLAERARYQW
jgi:hypothetical protein